MTEKLKIISQLQNLTLSIKFCALFYLFWGASVATANNNPPYSALSDLVFHNIELKQFAGKMAVRAITQDKSGYLWIGTVDGLYRFDGYEFKHYRHQTDNPNSLNENHIEDLVVDDSGYLWIATRYAGIARFDPKTENFIRFSADRKNEPSLSSNTIFEIELDVGGLWVATLNGLNFLDFSSLEIESYLIEDQQLEVNALERDSKGNLWLGTRDGLYFRDKETHNIVRINSHLGSNTLAKVKVKEVLEAKDGTIWLSTSYSGHWRYFPSNGSFQRLADKDPELKSSGSSILQIDEDQIWIANVDIAIYDASTGNLKRIVRSDSTLSYGMLSDSVMRLFQDASGLVWLGFRHAGLQFYNPANSAFSIVKNSPNNPNGISDSSVGSVLELKDGKLLVASPNNFTLDVIDRKTGLLETKKLPVTHENAPWSLSVNTMLEGNDNQIWLGSYPAFLSRYDRIKEKIENYRVPLNKQRHGAVLDMINDPETGLLWLAMSEGLLLFDPKQQKFKSVNQDFSGPLRLIERDAEGNILTGNKNGLFIWRKATSTWYHFNRNKNSRGTFVNDNVSGILADSQGRYWIGTENDLYLLKDWQSGEATFKSVSSALDREDLNSENLLEDKQGRIWISLDMYFDPKTWQYHKLSQIEKDNILAIKGVYNITKDGFIITGGPQGLLIIHPHRIQKWQYQPPLVINQIKIDQKISPLRENLIEIPSSSKSFSVNFAAIDFTEPDTLIYRYKLSGYDDRWIETSARQRVATYTALSPGNYTLQLSAKNRSGKWTPTSLKLSITVLPSYYQTWWFRALMLIIACLLTYQFIQWRVRKLAEKERTINELKLVAERADMMAELVEKKNQFLADVSHELRTPLTVLQIKVEALQQNIVNDIDASYEGLKTKIRDINNLITSISQLAQSDTGALHLELTNCNFNNSINNWAAEFKHFVEAKNMKWQAEIKLDNLPTILIDANKIKQVLANLISNSITYTDTPGTIRLTAKNKNSYLVVSVEDSKPGVSEQDLPHIFERLYRVESSRSRATGGSGLGLSICKAIIEAHNGSISASHCQLGGLAVVIKLPLPKG